MSRSPATKRSLRRSGVSRRRSTSSSAPECTNPQYNGRQLRNWMWPTPWPLDCHVWGSSVRNLASSGTSSRAARTCALTRRRFVASWSCAAIASRCPASRTKLARPREHERDRHQQHAVPDPHQPQHDEREHEQRQPQGRVTQDRMRTARRRLIAVRAAGIDLRHSQTGMGCGTSRRPVSGPSKTRITL